MDAAHIPVLRQEAITYLHVQPEAWYIDATFGRGGHTREIIAAGGYVIAMDCDQEAITYGQIKFVKEIEQGRLILVRENFEHIDEVVQKLHKDGQIAGVLADFGVSSPQLDEGKRGFSFQQDSVLDMRMDDRLGVTAKDLVNALGKKELIEIITKYGDESYARVIVDAIVTARSKKPIESTQELANIIERKIGRRGRLHPATKTFMSLRMVVNDELGSIERFLPRSFDCLQTKGRLVTISFHEGEDRLVKHYMQQQESMGRAISITKKPIEPSESETTQNIRSRSAKLRCLEKTL